MENVLELLQGNWRSDDGIASFTILGNNIINIVPQPTPKLDKAPFFLKDNGVIGWGFSAPHIGWGDMKINKLTSDYLELLDYRVALKPLGSSMDGGELKVFKFRKI